MIHPLKVSAGQREIQCTIEHTHTNFRLWLLLCMGCATFGEEDPTEIVFPLSNFKLTQDDYGNEIVSCVLAITKGFQIWAK